MNGHPDGVSRRAMELANKVLAKCAANDPTFPRPSEAVRLAWAEHIGMTSLSEDDLLAAVTAVYKAQTDPSGVFRMLPGHVIAAARAIRTDRMQRGHELPPPPKAVPLDESEYPHHWTTQQRLAASWARVKSSLDQRQRREQVSEDTTRRNKINEIVNTLATDVPDDESDDIPTHMNVLMVPCSYCGVPAGRRCEDAAGRLIENIAGHPSRVRDAAIHAGHSDAAAERIVTAVCRRQEHKMRVRWAKSNENRARKPLRVPEDTPLVVPTHSGGETSATEPLGGQNPYPGDRPGGSE